MKKVVLYLCGIDWQHEIGDASDLEGRMPFYSTIEQLKSERPCWEECGIVEVEVTSKRWVSPQEFFKPQKNKFKR